MNKYRTHNCNELSKDDIGKNVKFPVGFTEKEIMETYCSWYQRSLWYYAVCHRNKDKNFSLLEKTKPESVLLISGKVVKDLQRLKAKI